MDEDSSHCTGGSDQNYAKEKEMQKGKVIVRGGFTNNWEQKRSERQGRKRKLYPAGCKVPGNSMERYEGPLKWTMQRIEKDNRMKKTRDLRKLEISKEHFMQRWAWRTEMVELTEAEEIKKVSRIHRWTIFKKILVTSMTMMAWSLT